MFVILRVTINLLCLLDFTWNIKKHLSKKVAPVTYTLEKTFFAVATFEGYESLLFRHIKKLVVYFGLC